MSWCVAPRTYLEFWELHGEQRDHVLHPRRVARHKRNVRVALGAVIQDSGERRRRLGRADAHVRPGGDVGGGGVVCMVHLRAQAHQQYKHAHRQEYLGGVG